MKFYLWQRSFAFFVSCACDARDGLHVRDVISALSCIFGSLPDFKAVLSIWRVMVSVENINVSYMALYHLLPLLSAGMERILPQQEVAQAEHVPFLVPATAWASLAPWNGNTEENMKHTSPQELHMLTQHDPYRQHEVGEKYSHWLSLAKIK